jgi:glycosyltransferase involved in cell wall biosynthesis
MKKVLLVTYYFPPSGGPGVQRVLKFVKYLPQFGWQPVVLTVENGDYPARDESLLKEIPEGTTIYRTKIFEPYRLYRRLTGKPADAPVDVENIPKGSQKKSVAESLAAFVRSTFFIPDARIGWIARAVPAGMRIIREERIDAIYSSSPPYTTAVIADILHRRTKLPWIAGFRDPWIGFISSPDRWSVPRAVDQWMEHSVAKDANILEAAWRGIIADFQQKYPAIGQEKFFHLPNGFDAEDYPVLEPKHNDKFTVVYTGSMYGRRNPKTFLQAVEELVQEGAVDRTKIRLSFIGRFGGEVKEMLTTTSVSYAVEIVPYLPHGESITRLMTADALLLVVDESKESAEIVPGKVYEYLGARRPIIALAQEGAIAELLRETNAGTTVHNQDIPAIKRAFLQFYQEFINQQTTFAPNEEAVRRYDRRETTRRLAELLEYLHKMR